MTAREMQQRAEESADAIRTIGRRLAENPVAAVLTAVAAGFLVGLVLRLFEKQGREK